MMHLNAVARMVCGSLSGGWGGVVGVEELLALSTKRPAKKLFELNERYRKVLRCKDFEAAFLVAVNAADRSYAALVKVEGCAFRPFRYPRC